MSISAQVQSKGEEDWDSGGRRFGSSDRDIPFEFVGKIASSSSVAKTSHIECGTTATRHVGRDYSKSNVNSKKQDER